MRGQHDAKISSMATSGDLYRRRPRMLVMYVLPNIRQIRHARNTTRSSRWRGRRSSRQRWRPEPLCRPHTRNRAPLSASSANLRAPRLIAWELGHLSATRTSGVRPCGAAVRTLHQAGGAAKEAMMFSPGHAADPRSPAVVPKRLRQMADERGDRGQRRSRLAIDRNDRKAPRHSQSGRTCTSAPDRSSSSTWQVSSLTIPQPASAASRSSSPCAVSVGANLIFSAHAGLYEVPFVLHVMLQRQ